jgi:hypothetical protein
MQIKKYLDEEVHKKNRLQHLPHRNNSNEIKHMSLSRETISHWLTKLASKGVLKKEGNRYCRTGFLYSEVELISRIFGDNLIFLFFELIKDKDAKERFLQMLDVISVLTAYSFLRFLQPKTHRSSTTLNKEKLFPLFDRRQKKIFRHVWVENAIPTSTLLFSI